MDKFKLPVDIDWGRFLGKIKVKDGKVQVVTETTGGEETTGWYTWQQIKAAIEAVGSEKPMPPKPAARVAESEE